MKKLTVLLLALIGVLCYVFTGCANRDVFTEKFYASGDNEIEKITVQVADRELEIGKSEDHQIHIDYFDGEKEFLEIQLIGQKELTVKLTYNREWTDFIGTKPSQEYRKIKIRIPNDYIAAFSANTTNEAITVKQLSFQEMLNLNTSGSDIVCEQVGVGKSIGLTVKNGDIKGSILGGWDDFSISCNIKKGDCNLPTLKEEGEKSFFADCNNGDIEIEFVQET